MSAAAIATVIVLVLLTVVSYRATGALGENTEGSLSIRLRGYQWWWEVTYLDPSPETVFTAANELLFFIDALRSVRYGARAGDNPWDAPGLEWATASPPPSYNFLHVPVVGSAYPLWAERGALPVATGLRIGRRELFVTTVAAARPEARESSPRNSIWPLLTALATTVMLIWSIFSPWAVVWGAIPVGIALIGWFWPKGTPEDEA